MIVDEKKNASVNFRHTIHVFYAIHFSKLENPFFSDSEDLSALCPVESVKVVMLTHSVSLCALCNLSFEIVNFKDLKK